MKVKTADLIDAPLDWALAQCASVEVEYINDGITRCLLRVSPFTGVYTPSTNWSQGGPIIDREGIQWARVGGQMSAWSGFDYLEWRRNWELPPQLPSGAGFGTGPTVLSAAMRCFVSSRLGDEVDIPEELLT